MDSAAGAPGVEHHGVFTTVAAWSGVHVMGVVTYAIIMFVRQSVDNIVMVVHSMKNVSMIVQRAREVRLMGEVKIVRRGSRHEHHDGQDEEQRDRSDREYSSKLEKLISEVVSPEGAASDSHSIERLGSPGALSFDRRGDRRMIE